MSPLTLHHLTSIPGARRRRRRVGRGNASRGTYSGRGAKGQRSRTGGRRGLIRRSMKSLLERVPKQRGFSSRHAKYAVVNLADLERTFSANAEVTPQALERHRLIATTHDGVKVLGGGSLTKALTVRVQACSASAKAAIEQAGGSVVKLGRSVPPTEGKGA